MGYIHFNSAHERRIENICVLKEDLVVRGEQSAPLNRALKSAHTARHSPQTPLTPHPNKQLSPTPLSGEASRNMVSVPEGALGSTRV